MKRKIYFVSLVVKSPANAGLFSYQIPYFLLISTH